MTRQEAFEAMERGYKVKHSSFVPGTFLHEKDGSLSVNDTYYCEVTDFKVAFESSRYSSGWNIVEAVSIDHIEHASVFLNKLKGELDRLSSYDVPIRVDGKLVKDVKLTGDLTIEITTL